MPPHTITNENYGEALDAIRDILLLYVDMAESYSGFGHATNVNVRFDPVKFVDAELATQPGYAPLVDLAFLRTGSAIAILCALYDEWCEFDAVPGRGFKKAIEAGKLSHTPDIEAVAREAIQRGPMAQDDPWFDRAVEPIYQRHVIGHFEALSRMHRRPRTTTEYVLDGARITSLEAFYDEVSRVLIPGANWGRNLDAFNDILRGGFGTPAEGFIIHWVDADTSRRHLGYAETARQLELRLERCHPANRTHVASDLEDARACRGPTVFDWLVEIIEVHGPGGGEAEDGVELRLR